MPPELRIRIKKKTDGAAALSCIRADESTTWQRQEGQLGRVFPLHDLTHFAVETVLGFRGGFYGLLADGWDISDFGSPENKGAPLHEANLVELIVGFFDLERMTGILADAQEMNERILSHYEEKKVPAPELRLTEAEVVEIRELRSTLIARWRALPAGETLELAFDRTPADTNSAARS